MNKFIIIIILILVFTVVGVTAENCSDLVERMTVGGTIVLNESVDCSDNLPLFTNSTLDCANYQLNFDVDDLAIVFSEASRNGLMYNCIINHSYFEFSDSDTFYGENITFIDQQDGKAHFNFVSTEDGIEDNYSQNMTGFSFRNVVADNAETLVVVMISGDSDKTIGEINIYGLSISSNGEAGEFGGNAVDVYTNINELGSFEGLVVYDANVDCYSGCEGGKAMYYGGDGEQISKISFVRGLFNGSFLQGIYNVFPVGLIDLENTTVIQNHNATSQSGAFILGSAENMNLNGFRGLYASDVQNAVSRYSVRVTPSISLSAVDTYIEGGFHESSYGNEDDTVATISDLTINCSKSGVNRCDALFSAPGTYYNVTLDSVVSSGTVTVQFLYSGLETAQTRDVNGFTILNANSNDLLRIYADTGTKLQPQTTFTNVDMGGMSLYMPKILKDDDTQIVIFNDDPNISVFSVDETGGTTDEATMPANLGTVDLILYLDSGILNGADAVNDIELLSGGRLSNNLTLSGFTANNIVSNIEVDNDATLKLINVTAEDVSVVLSEYLATPSYTTFNDGTEVEYSNPGWGEYIGFSTVDVDNMYWNTGAGNQEFAEANQSTNCLDDVGSLNWLGAYVPINISDITPSENGKLYFCSRSQWGEHTLYEATNYVADTSIDVFWTYNTPFISTSVAVAFDIEGGSYDEVVVNVPGGTFSNAYMRSLELAMTNSTEFVVSGVTVNESLVINNSVVSALLLSSYFNGVVVDNGQATKAYLNEFNNVTAVLTSDYCSNNYTGTQNSECPNIISINCPSAIPNENNQPAPAEFEINFLVNVPRGQSTIVGYVGQIVDLSRYGTCSDVVLDSTTINVTCSVQMNYWEESNLYDAHVTIADELNRNATYLIGNELTSSNACEYYLLLARSLSVETASFDMDVGDSNRFADNPIVIYNTGNYDYTNLSITAYNLKGSTLPNTKLAATNFKMNDVESISGAVVLQDSTAKYLDFSLSAGNSSSETLYLIGSVPESQYPQSYYSDPVWTLSLT